MFTLFAALLIAVPSPKQAPPPVDPLVGSWAIDWHPDTCLQTTFLYADGSCFSPEYGAGLWSQDDNGFVWFSERGNQSHYVMSFDLETGIGSGWCVGSDGEITGGREIRIRRGERLPMPRKIE